MKKVVLIVLLALSSNAFAQKTITVTDANPNATVGIVEIQSSTLGPGYPRYKSVHGVLNVPASGFTLYNTNNTYFPFFSYSSSGPIYSWNKYASATATPVPYGSTVLNNAADAGTQYFYNIKLQIVINGSTYTPTVGISPGFTASGPGWTVACVPSGNSYDITVDVP